MLEAIIFDLDDTLYEYKHIDQEAMDVLQKYTCECLNISETKFQEAFMWAKNETKKTLKNTGSSHNRMLYCQKLLEYLNQPPVGMALDMYEIYWGYILEHMELRDGAIELLRYCKDCGIKIGICTDLTANIQHRKIRKLGIALWVDAIVTSEEAGAEKPSDMMFQLILRKLNVAAEGVLFVGDNLEKDVRGAEKMGMKAIWLNQSKVSHCITISSLSEVRAVMNEYI